MPRIVYGDHSTLKSRPVALPRDWVVGARIWVTSSREDAGRLIPCPCQRGGEGGARGLGRQPEATTSWPNAQAGGCLLRQLVRGPSPKLGHSPGGSQVR